MKKAMMKLNLIFRIKKAPGLSVLCALAGKKVKL